MAVPTCCAGQGGRSKVADVGMVPGISLLVREQVMRLAFHQHINQLHSLSCDVASTSHLQQVLEPAHHTKSADT